MKRFNISMPKVTTTELLAAVGLERRRSTGLKVATGLGIAAVGAALGAGAVLARALMLGRERQGDSLGDFEGALESAVS